MTIADPSTLDTAKTRKRAGHFSYIGLSIICHPDIRRVGQTARLLDPGQNGEVELCRSTPLFRDNSSGYAAPLLTQRVSRTPLRIDLREDSTFRLSVPAGMELHVDDERVEGEAAYPLELLETGVQLRLGKYVLLKLAVFALPPAGSQELPELLGQSVTMQQLRAEIGRVADLEVSVLLRGETGSGKELVASALHRLSPRRVGPHIQVNMAAIPASVAIAELFGYARGAFTGANGERSGYFLAAHRGTLFLDEIGQTASEVQAALLRTMETGVIQPLGGQLREVSVRLIAATDTDLEAAVEAGRFSHALLRRFGYEIRVPPLRERREDVPELFARFLAQELTEFGEGHRLALDEQDRHPFMTAQLVQQLMEHDWPGNVRELRGAARRLAIHNRGRPSVHIDEVLQSQLATAAPAPAGASTEKRDTRQISEEEVQAALSLSGFEIERAARELRVSRGWLHARMAATPSIRKAKDLERHEIGAALERHAGNVKAAALDLKVSLRGLQLQITRLNMHPKDR